MMSETTKQGSGWPQRDYFTRMQNLLRLMGQPVDLRLIESVPVLLMGPYAPPDQTSGPGHFLSICPRPQLEQAVELPASKEAWWDFQIRCPFQIEKTQRQDVAWLIGFLNLWLPLGSYHMSPEGQTLLVYELPLPDYELPASVFLETMALLLDCYTQTAPLLQAVSRTRLQAEEVRSWLGQHKLQPRPLKQALKSHRQPVQRRVS